MQLVVVFFPILLFFVLPSLCSTYRVLFCASLSLVHLGDFILCEVACCCWIEILQKHLNVIQRENVFLVSVTFVQPYNFWSRENLYRRMNVFSNSQSVFDFLRQSLVYFGSALSRCSQFFFWNAQLVVYKAVSHRFETRKKGCLGDHSSPLAANFLIPNFLNSVV